MLLVACTSTQREDTVDPVGKLFIIARRLSGDLSLLCMYVHGDTSGMYPRRYVARRPGGFGGCYVVKL